MFTQVFVKFKLLNSSSKSFQRQKYSYDLVILKKKKCGKYLPAYFTTAATIKFIICNLKLVFL